MFMLTGTPDSISAEIIISPDVWRSRFFWITCGMNMASGIKHTGLPMGCSYHPAAQRRLFGGKELDRSAGLNLYDQEARLYDPATGCFTRPDPLSHDYAAVSHYSFCLNNPLILTDPTGRKIDTSGMNEQELDYFNTALDEMKLSKLFGAVWESLSNSEKVYSFKFGKLDNTNVVKGDGQTKETETGCEIILNEQFAQKDENMNSVLAEESFHAYQSDNNDLGADPNFNYEFEAKTFVALCFSELGWGSALRGNEFLNSIFGDSDTNSIVDISRSPYPEQYMKGASEFRKNYINYNRDANKKNNKVVSSYYTAPTTRAPRTLLNLINSVLHK